MGNDPTETKQEESVWQVQFGEAACMMTRRELDAALARDDIDPYTLVREPGTLRWLSLGTVRGIESETMNLSSLDVEVVPSDYTPSFIAPHPVPIETEGERPPESLTKEERAVARPRGLHLPHLVLVGAAVFGGVFLAHQYLPSLSSATSFVRAHANASSTQTSVAGITSIAPPTTSTPSAAPVVARVATPPAPPPPQTPLLLASKPRASAPPARATSSVRPAGPTAKKAAPATTRSTTAAAAKAKPSTTKAAPKVAPPKSTAKPASKPASASVPSAPTRTTQPLKPDPARSSRPTR